MTIALDQVVLLAPILVLGVVLLLGFAGCHRVFGLDPLLPFLTLRVRVPTALTVREIVFTWDPPNAGSDSVTLTKPDPTGFEGDENLFDHPLTGERDTGGWTVRCRVTVAGGAAQGVEAMGSFILDGSLAKPVAAFRANGAPAALMVVFLPLEEDSG